MRIAWAVLLVAVVVGVAGCDDELKGTFGPPQPPTPVQLKTAPQKAPPVAAVGAPAPVVKPAGLTREDVRQRHGTRTSGPCATGDEWMGWVDEPRTPDEVAMLRTWALDGEAPDRHIAINALLSQRDPSLAETWRKVIVGPELVRTDPVELSMALLARGDDSDVPLALAALKTASDPELVKLRSEAPSNLTATALLVRLADARAQRSARWQADLRANDPRRAPRLPGLPDVVAAQLVQRFVPSFTACTAAAPATAQERAVTLTLVISASGAVTRSSLAPTHAGEAWAECLVKAGERVVFPASDGETEVQVPLRVGRATAP
ncbi:MAG: hypothetical protein Q8N26_28340 [Myxococcales bacterium]|nr:hypothetical protein [Myxococcales bacterium]